MVDVARGDWEIRGDEVRIGVPLLVFDDVSDAV
jgi:hypothetical protein